MDESVLIMLLVLVLSCSSALASFHFIFPSTLCSLLHQADRAAPSDLGRRRPISPQTHTQTVYSFSFDSNTCLRQFLFQ
jgi:hypothetical protein